MTNRVYELRSLIKQEGLIAAPSAYDALTAKLIEISGFKAISTTGYGISATLLGAPDIGLLTFYESLEVHKRIVATVKIPVIADIDTGYGGPLNVARTVGEFERIGVSGVIIEDQIEPKKCGYIPAIRRVLPIEKMIAKIKAARDARENEKFMIIARTDADDISTEEAVRRMKAYLKAGADMVKSQPKSIDQLRKEIEEINAPMHIGLGIGPLMDVSINDLKDWGLKEGIVSFPLALLFSSVKAIIETLKTIYKERSIKNIKNKIIQFNEFNELIDLKKYIDLEKKYEHSYQEY
jgi:methylisocitrate lyase